MDETYDVVALGGNTTEIRRAGAYGWDEETVLFALRQGGRPPLVHVQATRESPMTVDVQCTFRAPDGSLVTNVMVPMSLFSHHYAGRVRTHGA